MQHSEISLLESLQFAEKQRDEKVMLLCLKSLADIYEEKNDFKEALVFYKRLHHLELEIANKEIAGKSKDIMDSIKYAYRIQTAISPPEYLVNRLLPDHFILYKPKDVVSGDFYFVSEFKDKVLFAAVDCTGHGVPGALMSVIGFNGLIQAVGNKKVNTAGQVLSYLDEYVNEVLRQTHDESGVKDSMDLAVCTVDFEKNVLSYAGAYNPLYYVHKNELFEIKADKLPIGVNVDGVTDIYTDHIIQLDDGDTAYIFSDGYADQFGGPRNKKFKYRQLKELILSVQDKSMSEQGVILEKTLNDWQADEEQIDDILVMGVRI
jgi:serine phosphatase RsbU (regulator of sigma subunit)